MEHPEVVVSAEVFIRANDVDCIRDTLVSSWTVKQSLNPASVCFHPRPSNPKLPPSKESFKSTTRTASLPSRNVSMSVYPSRSWAPVAGIRGAITIRLRTYPPLAKVFVPYSSHIAWRKVGFEEYEAGLLHQGAVVLAYVHATAASEEVLRRLLAFFEGGEARVEDEGDHGRGECDGGACEVSNVGWWWRGWNVNC